MNAPTVPQGKPSKKNANTSVEAPAKGTDYVVAAPSNEQPSAFQLIMSVSHSELEY